MAPRAFVLLALLVSVAFAGCAGGDEGESTSSSTSDSGSVTGSSSGTSTSRSTSATSTTSSSSTGTAVPANTPPTGSISAVVNGTSVDFTLSGADADGDALSWELVYGDDAAKATGTALPTNVTHTYAVGNYTANFTLSDGTASTSYEVNLTVASTGPGVVTQAYSGEWVGGPYACALRRTAYTEADPQRNVLWDNVLIDPATIGRPFTAVFTATAPAAVIVMELTTEGGDAKYSEAIIPGTGGTLSGEVPEDAFFAFFSSCGGANLTVEYATS